MRRWTITAVIITDALVTITGTSGNKTVPTTPFSITVTTAGPGARGILAGTIACEGTRTSKKKDNGVANAHRLMSHLAATSQLREGVEVVM